VNLQLASEQGLLKNPRLPIFCTGHLQMFEPPKKLRIEK
jgi:hypothetical protein